MGKQGSLIKRLTDVIFSALVLILASPILLFVALAIKLESKGPVLFIQERAGLSGKNFKLYKFRGMVDNATLYGPELTQVNDPRITKVGKFLRRTSIDEIPNFFNVLLGDMSIVGPRPEIISITVNYNEELRKVFDYKPGITGYSQINGRQMLSPEQRTHMEIYYYSSANFWSDLIIILKTIAVVITNHGNN
jgi:lipopolysaccharide/colanic/teichoic acid biosynthesis glycosyltransferase